MTGNLSSKLVIGADGQPAEKAFQSVGDAAGKMAQRVEKSGQSIDAAVAKQAKSVKTLSGEFDASATAVTRAEATKQRELEKTARETERQAGRMEMAIRRQVDIAKAAAEGTGKSGELTNRILSKGLDPARFKEQLDALRELEIAHGKVGMSSKQMSAALRGVPAQFTDIATSIAGGQNPMTVFLQQGGQLKDMFGGAGNAARAMGGYVAGLATPLNIGIAAVGGLAAAAYAGSREMDAYRTELTMTGFAAGVTAGQLDAMARGVKAAGGGTQGAASEALVALVGQGRVTKDILQEVAVASMQWSKATGQGVADVAKSFADLAKDPLGASVRLNDSMNYLTSSTYNQIKALQDQGRMIEAAAAAQKAYSDTLRERAPEMLENLGLIEKTWNGITSAIKSTWDAMKDIGREDSAEVKLVALQAAIAASVKKRGEIGNESAFAPALDKEIDRLREQESVLQSTLREMQKGLGIREREAAQVKARSAWDDIVKANLSDTARLEAEITRARNIGAAAGMGQAAIEAVVAQIRAKNAKKEQEYSQASLAALTAERIERERYVEALQQYGAAAEAISPAQKTVLKIEEELKGKLSESVRAIKEKELAEAKRILTADRLQKIEEKRLAQEKETLDVNAKTAESAYESAIAAEKQLNAQIEQNAVMGLSVTQLASHKGALDLDRAAMLERRAELLLSMGGQDEYAKALQREAQALRGLAEARNAGAGKQEGLDKAKQDLGDFNKLVDQINQAKVNNIFGPMTEGALKLAGALQAVVGMSEATAKALAANDIANANNAAKHAEERIRIERQSADATLSAYASITGAVRGYAKEGSKTYNALLVAEKTFRAFELASAIANAAKKIGLFGSVATAKVVGDQTMASSATIAAGVDVAASTAQGTASAAAAVSKQAAGGDPYSAFPRMAAMAAAMAALGFVVAGGGGGGSFAPTNNGTGTVLGDKDAQSESLANALELLNNTQDIALTYSREMAASLRAIEGQIGGLTNIYLRTGGGGLDALTGGIETGGFETGLSRTLKNLNPLTGLFGPAVDGFRDKFIGALFGGKNNIVGSGIAAGAQTLGDVLSGGFDGSTYADVETKKRVLGVTTSTKRRTQYGELDNTIEDQITGIFAGVGDAVTSASDLLGLDMAKTEADLQAYVIELGRIDLQGLSGEQISEKLSAVFGAEADKIAASVIPGFEALQEVGEGYFETLTRVSVQFENVQMWMRRFGDDLGAVGIQGAIAADALIDAFGGLEEYTSISAQYFEDFYTEQERNAIRTQELTDAMAELGFAMPASNEAFRALVDAQDLSTEAGRAAYAALLQLSGVFADVTDAAAEAAEEQEREAQRLRDAWTSIGGTIQDEVNRIRGLTAAAQGQDLSYLQSDFAIKTAAARAGDQEAAKALSGLSQSLLQSALKGATSEADYLRIAAQVAASLEETMRLTGSAPVPPSLALPGLPVGEVALPPLPSFAPQGDSALAEKVQQLIEEVKTLRRDNSAENQSIALSASRIHDILDDVTQGGTSVRTTEVAA